ncbi:siderophore-interacting protein [Actinokineospora sp. NBRC 105648]|uniref:siderophore-interacting protein n=1 Tax=Actinokineospora sp. NBRC 105648 TaxID=3032206 RepID=UPI0024A09DED|nr:siderophore-interacting protein [Actinokineospora sp. NBRC 105648]GLZ40761.1 siderophore-interacting protein [Actinokineospora sp. NBRC 105648]
MTGYRVTVRRTEHVTPLMVRITVGGPGLAEYEGSGLPDESCRVRFGELTRNYTIRRRHPERSELDIDFVLHEGGVAATWARSARPGDEITISGSPAGKYRLPETAERLLVVGDATALPAIGRILEELPPTVAGHAVCVVDNPAERQDIVTHATIEWVYADHRGAGEAVVQAVRDRARPGVDEYLWVAGEAAATRTVRGHLRHTLGLPAECYDTIGYWRLDAERWQRRYREVAAVIDPKIAAAEAIADDEQYFDVVDGIYAEAGL